MQIKLRSSDGVIFQVHINIVKVSNTLNDMLNSCGIEECIDSIVPVSTIHSTVLLKVLEWCHHHQLDKVLTAEEEAEEDRVKCTPQNELITWHDNQLKRRDNIPAWDVAFMGNDHDMIFKLLNAANYLNIPGLLKVGCKTVALMMKDKSPKEICATFKIETDASFEEERKMHKDYVDLFDEFPDLRPDL